MHKQIQSAFALYSSGQIEKALDLLKTLVNDYPNEAVIHNLSGACYSSLGRLDDAVNCYKKALIIKQDYGCISQLLLFMDNQLKNNKLDGSFKKESKF